MKSTIAAIDFGTCKIVTLVAETSGTQRCDIIGAGIAAYDGFLDGEWNNTVMLNEAIQKSITEAETQSKRKIREINVGVPGEFTRVYAVETSVTIQGADPHVTPRHVEKIFANADKQLSPVRGVVVHRSPAWFMVDGGKKTLEPVGLKGTELKALVSFVVADTFFLDDVMARLRDMNITVSGFFSSSTGEAMLYLLEEDRDRTAILIDIGYLCTDVMAVEGDAVIFQKTLPVGGGHIAADVAEGLSIPLESAEQIKREYVYGISTISQSYTVSGGEGVKTETFTQEQVAVKVSKSRSAVANALRLLSLPEQVLDFVRTGELSAGHARTLLALENADDILLAANKIITDELSVRKTEELVKKLREGQKPAKSTDPEVELALRKLEERAMSGTGNKVKIKHTPKNTGKIEIFYNSTAELEKLIEMLS